MFTQTRIGLLAQRLANLDEGVAFKFVMDNSLIKEKIIEFNTRDQLYEKGVNSKGVKLSDIGGDYSNYTLQLHPEKIRDRITLYDTGEFYESWRVVVDETGITIYVDPIKEDTNLLQEWGEDVVGLADESMEKLKPYVLELYREYILDTILAA